MRDANWWPGASRAIYVIVLAVLLSACNNTQNNPNPPNSLQAAASAAYNGGCQAAILNPKAERPTDEFRCNRAALLLAGVPPRSVLVGSQYRFRPLMIAAPDATVTFSVKNRPTWATFDATTGLLEGVPSVADAGTDNDVVISASTGKVAATLPQFAITVMQPTKGTATLSWVPPTTNSDGTPITNLVGYRIIYGNSPSELTRAVSVDRATLTNYVIDNLTPGRWYFAIEAVNDVGETSDPTAVVSAAVGAS